MLIHAKIFKHTSDNDHRCENVNSTDDYEDLYQDVQGYESFKPPPDNEHGYEIINNTDDYIWGNKSVKLTHYYMK